MEVGAGISPKLLLARLSFQSPLKFGLASAGNTASVMTAKVANNRLGDIQQLLSQVLDPNVCYREPQDIIAIDAAPKTALGERNARQSVSLAGVYLKAGKDTGK